MYPGLSSFYYVFKDFFFQIPRKSFVFQLHLFVFCCSLFKFFQAVLTCQVVVAKCLKIVVDLIKHFYRFEVISKLRRIKSWWNHCFNIAAVKNKDNGSLICIL
jgi:hypothetical protein